MFDSKSDAPRGGVHFPRSWREHGKGDRIEYGTRPNRVLATRKATKAAIDEAVEAMLIDAAEDAYENFMFVVECEDAWAEHASNRFMPVGVGATTFEATNN